MILTTAATLLVLTAPQDSGAPEPAFEPIRVGGQLDPRLHGVWQVRGYGWVAELHATGGRIFDHGPAGTLRQQEDPWVLLEGSHFRRLGEQLQLTGLPGSSTIYTWDPLPRLPASHATPPGDDPVSVFDYFWNVMQAHYAYFELRGVDWKGRKKELRPRVSSTTTEEELWSLLCEAMTGFHDDHMTLEGDVNGYPKSFGQGFCRELDPALERGFAAQDKYLTLSRYRRWWFGCYRRHVLHGLLAGEWKTGAQDQLLWGRIGPIAYLNLRGMGGFTTSDNPYDEVAGVHELLSRVLTELADCEALVLDITMNTGGYDEVQMAVASHFVDRPRVGFRKIPLDVDPERPVTYQDFVLRPAAGTRFLKPISLVTSDYSVSAAEDFTLAMRELPHVTHRGVRTRGAFSDMLAKTLPNGWTLTLSNEAYVDVEGRNYEALGVPPDDPVPIFTREDLEYAHHDAILEIVDKMIAELD